MDFQERMRRALGVDPSAVKVPPRPPLLIQYSVQVVRTVTVTAPAGCGPDVLRDRAVAAIADAPDTGEDTLLNVQTVKYLNVDEVAAWDKQFSNTHNPDGFPNQPESEDEDEAEPDDEDEEDPEDDYDDFSYDEDDEGHPLDDKPF